MCVNICVCVRIHIQEHPHAWLMKETMKYHTDLPGAEMHEDIQQLHALFHSGDRVKRRGYDILHHHFQVLHTSTESAQQTHTTTVPN